MLHAILAGLALGGGLIVAIGAQNAFVIRQGVLNQHIFWVCLFCALSDAILIWGGTYGLGVILKSVPLLMPIMTYGGAAFLFWYGIKATRRVLAPQSLAEEGKTTTNFLWLWHLVRLSPGSIHMSILTQLFLLELLPMPGHKENRPPLHSVHHWPLSCGSSPLAMEPKLCVDPSLSPMFGVP